MKEDKKNLLLDNTVNYLLKSENFNMGHLSEELGVARKTLYNHFHSREELLKDATAHFFRSNRQRVEDIMESDLTFPARTRLLMDFVAEVIGNTEKFCAQKGILESDVEDVYKRNYEMIKRKIARFIEEGQEEDLIRGDTPPQIISNLFFALILGSIHNRDKEEAYSSYLYLITEGLAGEKARTTEIMRPLPPDSEI